MALLDMKGKVFGLPTPLVLVGAGAAAYLWFTRSGSSASPSGSTTDTTGQATDGTNASSPSFAGGGGGVTYVMGRPGPRGPRGPRGKPGKRPRKGGGRAAMRTTSASRSVGAFR